MQAKKKEKTKPVKTKVTKKEMREMDLTKLRLLAKIHGVQFVGLSKNTLIEEVYSNIKSSHSMPAPKAKTNKK